MRRWQRIVFLSLLPASLLGAFSASCLLFPDDTEKGVRVANIRPQVRITGGAATSDSAGVDYKVLFQWHGTDDDGVVSLFQYAVDDTVSEGAWRDTTGFSGLFRLRAATQHPDTSFGDWHTFHIRAIDNEFSVSRPDKRYFNARTIAPESEIMFPDLSHSTAPELFRSALIRWDGEDLDSSRPDGKPIAYELKLVRIEGSIQPEAQIIDSLRVGDNFLLDTLTVGSKKDWLRVPSTTQQLQLRDLPVGQSLAFGIRAVDEAGAIEPAFEKNRNYIAFAVRATIPKPFVTVSEATLGLHRFPLDGEIWEVSVPSDREIRFKWEGDAASYGSLPGNSNYALDIPDVEDETLRDPRGIGGWIGWGNWEGNLYPYTFPRADGEADHTFFLKMRDISDARETEQLCQVRIHVVVFTQQKFALVVDDSRLSGRGAPDDASHDLFIRNELVRRLYQLGRVDEVSVFGAQETRNQRAIEIRLETFAQYQNIIWHSDLLGTTTLTGLNLHERRKKRLSAFLGAGGNLWILGGRICGMQLGAAGDGGGAGPGNYVYPVAPPNRDPNATPTAGFEFDSFLWKFMHYRTWIWSTPFDATPEQQQATGLVAARSLHPAYPDLRIDPARWDPFALINCSEDDSSHCRYRGGLVQWEGLRRTAPAPVPSDAGCDSVYAAKTFNYLYDWRARQPFAISSNADNAIIGQRYESTSIDTLEGRQQGRTLVWDFQPYYFDHTAVKDAGTAAVNWLITGRDY